MYIKLVILKIKKFIYGFIANCLFGFGDKNYFLNKKQRTKERIKKIYPSREEQQLHLNHSFIHDEQLGQKVMEKAGKHSYACPYFCAATEKTTVGAFCSIALNVTLGTTQHPTNFLSTHPFTYFKPRRLGDNHRQLAFNYVRPVTVGNDVWIGKNAVVHDGLTIGDGAIIGTSSVVTKDVPPYAIVAGVPARILRYRFDEDTISKLLELKWWELDDRHLEDLPYDDLAACIERLTEIRKRQAKER